MKTLYKLFLTFIISIATISTFGFQFSGKIKQMVGDKVTITVYCEDNVEKYDLFKEGNFINKYSNFSLDLKENKFYTLHFEGKGIYKMVYIDTRNIFNVNSFICKLKIGDSIIYYSPNKTATSIDMRLEYLDYLNKNFSIVRNYKDIGRYEF